MGVKVCVQDWLKHKKLGLPALRSLANSHLQRHTASVTSLVPCQIFKSEGWGRGDNGLRWEVAFRGQGEEGYERYFGCRAVWCMMTSGRKQRGKTRRNGRDTLLQAYYNTFCKPDRQLLPKLRAWKKWQTGCMGHWVCTWYIICFAHVTHCSHATF